MELHSKGESHSDDGGCTPQPPRGISFGQGSSRFIRIRTFSQYSHYRIVRGAASRTQSRPPDGWQGQAKRSYWKHRKIRFRNQSPYLANYFCNILKKGNLTLSFLRHWSHDIDQGVTRISRNTPVTSEGITVGNPKIKTVCNVEN